jgi:ABC-type iron transport system FetAB ATPase subunit
MITAHNYFHQAITDILQQNRFLTYEINKALPWKYKIQNTKIKHHELLRLLANFTLDLRLISTLKFLSQIHVM